VKGFLHTERKLFLELGISADATDRLISHAYELRESLETWTYDRAQILPALLQFRERVCSVSERTPRPPHSSLPSWMWRVWYAVAGGTVIVANVSAQAMQILPDAGREVSIAYGGALVARTMESAISN